MFVVLLSFSKSLAHVAKVYDQTKCLLLNAEPCMVKPTIIDMNPVELKYDPFMISLNKCTAKSNVWSLEICLPNETKDINFKAWIMLNQWQNIFHVIVNANSIVKHVIQIKNGIIKHVNMNVKIIVSSKKVIAGIPAPVFVRIVSIKKLLLILQ